MRVEEPREQVRLQDDVFQLLIKKLFPFRVQFFNMFHLCDYYFINFQLPTVFPLSLWSPQSLRKTPMGLPVKNNCPFPSRKNSLALPSNYQHNDLDINRGKRADKNNGPLTGIVPSLWPLHCSQRMLSEGYTFTAPRPFPLLAAAAFQAGFIHLTRRNCFNKTLQNLSYRTLPRRHSVATWRFEHTDDRHSIGENFYDTCAFQSIRERRQSTERGQKQAARIW